MTIYKNLRKCCNCKQLNRNGRIYREGYGYKFICHECLSKSWKEFAENFPEPYIAPRITKEQFKKMFSEMK